MFVRRSGPWWEVWTPAKLNLFLEVLFRREDGFHEIETLVTAVSIFDTLYFAADRTGQMTFDGQWAAGLRGQEVFQTPYGRQRALGDLPEGTDNIVMRAARLLRHRAGVDSGARLRLVKRIPSASGLGGASSDAAATLVAANRAWRLGWTGRRLACLAAELGSDVPFFLGPGMAVCRGRGERTEPVPSPPGLHVVVVRPPVGLSTPRVYGCCRAADRPARVGPLVEKLRSGDMSAVGSLLVNRLRAAAESLSPWIGRLRREFDGLDVVGHEMSGSGSGYFGICRHARHARRIAGQLRKRGVGRVWCARTVRVAGGCR